MQTTFLKNNNNNNNNSKKLKACGEDKLVIKIKKS